MEETDETISEAILSKDDGREFKVGTVVKIIDNVLKTATGIDIPENWYTLLFSVNTLYEDSMLIINTESNVCARMYRNDLDIVEVNS